jgi:hypothetical protein
MLPFMALPPVVGACYIHSTTGRVSYFFVILDIPSFFAILLVFFSKYQDNKVDKDMRIFEKKRKAFAVVLSSLKKVIVSIKSQFSWEYDKFKLINEVICDEFEFDLQKEMLYLTDDDIYNLDFIIKLLRDNSTWQYNIMQPEECAGFQVKDLDVIEYLYNILAVNFRNQLFKKENKRKETHQKIFLFKTSNLLKEIITHKKVKLMDESRFIKFDYTMNSIKVFLYNCQRNMDELTDLLDDIITMYKSNPDKSEFDIEKIGILTEYFFELK